MIYCNDLLPSQNIISQTFYNTFQRRIAVCKSWEHLENARTEIRKGIPLSWTISIWSKVKSGNDAFWNPKERLARRAIQILMQNYLCNWISAYSPSMLLNFHSKFPPGRGIQLKYLPGTIKTTLQGNETSTFRLHRLLSVFLIR